MINCLRPLFKLRTTSFLMRERMSLVKLCRMHIIDSDDNHVDNPNIANHDIKIRKTIINKDKRDDKLTNESSETISIKSNNIEKIKFPKRRIAIIFAYIGLQYCGSQKYVFIINQLTKSEIQGFQRLKKNLKKHCLRKI